jgi:hypothetical protein
VANTGRRLTRRKGAAQHRKDPRQARPGNRNTVKGPRVGRRDKPVTKDVAAPALPQPRAGAKLPHPPTGRAKVAGKDFAPGQNSHDGTVFRRTEDQLPRGNFTLFAKIVYHDAREDLYQRCVRMGRTGTNREVLALLELLGNRIEGLPTKKIEKTTHHEATFLLTQRDGSVIPALPSRGPVDQASEEDQIILGEVVPRGGA